MEIQGLGACGALGAALWSPRQAELRVSSAGVRGRADPTFPQLAADPHIFSPHVLCVPTVPMLGTPECTRRHGACPYGASGLEKGPSA